MSNDNQYYVGEFEIDSRKYAGQITIICKTGEIFLTLTIATDGFGKHYSKLETIKGSVGDGRVQITLINCNHYNGHIYFASHQNICFSVERMFFSDKPLDSFLFDEYEAELENALRWSGLSCINRAEEKYIFFNEHKKTEFEYGDYQITFVSKVTQNLNYAPVDEENSVIERLVMKIRCSTKRPYDDFLRIRDLFISIICFCIKNNVNVLKQKFYNSDVCYSVSKSISIPYKIRFYEAIGKKTIFKLCHESEMNFTLNMLGQDFFAQAHNIETIEKLRPIFNLYLSLFKYQDMPIEMIFLNIVQALETYHSRFKYDKKDKYKAHIFTLESNTEFERLLKPLLWDSSQSDENCTFITLHSRLNDLMIFAENNLFRVLYVHDDFAQKISNTRNYLTHYDAKKEATALKGEDLSKAIYLLELILEYYVCLEFGIDRETYIRNELMQVFL